MRQGTKRPANDRRSSPEGNVTHVFVRGRGVERLDGPVCDGFFDEARDAPGRGAFQPEALSQRAVRQLVPLHVQDAGVEATGMEPRLSREGRERDHREQRDLRALFVELDARSGQLRLLTGQDDLVPSGAELFAHPRSPHHSGQPLVP